MNVKPGNKDSNSGVPAGRSIKKLEDENINSEQTSMAGNSLSHLLYMNSLIPLHLSRVIRITNPDIKKKS
ncbi:hypothetical protein GCM10027514_04660 [Azotobacter armeniacus]